jgi:GNAT superfamily N-acetyltransferase
MRRMNAGVLTLRHAEPADLSAVDRLMQRSYTKLLSADYPPSTMVLAVPRLARAQPALLKSGSYFLAEDGAGRVLAAGGWTRGRRPGSGPVDAGSVRHVATDPSVLRQGVGRALMHRVIQDATQAGMLWLDCLATRTAVPFYEALGFRALFPTEVTLAPGIQFPVLRMIAELPRRR